MPGPDTRAAHRTGLPPAGQPSFPQTEVAIAGCLVVPSPPPTSLPPLLALHCCAPHRHRWPTPPVVAQSWYVCENVLAAACCALLAAASAATCRGGVCRGSLCGAALPSPGAFDGAFVFSGTGIRHPAFDGSGTSALTLPSPFPAPAFAIRPSTAPAPPNPCSRSTSPLCTVFILVHCYVLNVPGPRQRLPQNALSVDPWLRTLFKVALRSRATSVQEYPSSTT